MTAFFTDTGGATKQRVIAYHYRDIGTQEFIMHERHARPSSNGLYQAPSLSDLEYLPGEIVMTSHVDCLTTADFDKAYARLAPILGIPDYGTYRRGA